MHVLLLKFHQFWWRNMTGLERFKIAAKIVKMHSISMPDGISFLSLAPGRRDVRIHMVYGRKVKAHPCRHILQINALFSHTN